MNYAKFFNSISLARKFPSWTHFNSPAAKSKALCFTDILASSKIFPFNSAEFELRDGSQISLDENKLNAALQYCPPAGNADLLKWLMEFQKSIHNPPLFHEKLSDICLTSGSMEGLCKTFEMLINPGDDVLVETPTYPGVLSALRPLQCNIVSVETDHYGIIPHFLEDVLSNHKSPKFLYTIPNGSNPTGASASFDRKQQIYEIASRHDLLILEDDPYYFLQFSLPRAPSYLSIDVDGRVLRYDSFSKVISSGLRLGFVTGPEPLVKKIITNHSTSSLHASHLSQMIAFELFTKWGVEGFENHVSSVVKFYKNQKDMMIQCANRWLKDLGEWSEPTAGMFLWVKLKNIKDTKKLTEEKAMKKEVLVVPGCAFYPDEDQATPFVRISFSLCSEEEMNEGFKRLAECIAESL